MPLKINLRHLESRDLHLEGELPVDELDFELRDEMVRMGKPLLYDLEVERLDDSVLVQGKLELALDCECVRCLKPFEFRLKLDHWALHLPLEGEEKVSLDGDFIDLTPFIREDMLLEFPQHPLCKTDCGGLKKSAKKPAVKPENQSAWAELNKLKL
jgi:uncharacterized metal-binding protein YceD (DUF177 family)